MTYQRMKTLTWFCANRWLRNFFVPKLKVDLHVDKRYISFTKKYLVGYFRKYADQNSWVYRKLIHYSLWTGKYDIKTILLIKRLKLIVNKSSLGKSGFDLIKNLDFYKKWLIAYLNQFFCNQFGIWELTIRVLRKCQTIICAAGYCGFCMKKLTFSAHPQKRHLAESKSEA